MKLLVIGSGGREHAIAWRLAQSPRVQKVFVAPGNGGTAREAGLENVAISAIDKLAEFALAENIYLTVVGPEAPLAEGIVDLFRSRSLRIFGPTRACARLESSKEFAKEFMVRHRIPTAKSSSFDVLADGEHVLPLATSQDHKRLRDGDGGPNTGGMGAYSPAPVVTPALHARVVREIIRPVLAGMAEEGERYTGFLYAGLMIDGSGNPRVLEFNCRLGDPEAQPILLRLRSDLLELIERAMEAKLDRVEADWDRRAALGVVLAAAGYPEAPEKGHIVTGLPAPAEDFRVFHS